MSSTRYAVKKTMGICRNFLVPLMICASSKPLTPGILMSSTMAATSLLEQEPQRLVGVVGAEEPVRRVVEDRLERVEVPRLVVDEQDVDRVRHRFPYR